MTREDAQSKREYLRSLCGDKGIMEAIDAKDLIDEIYDYFESRTCESCKHQEVEQHDVEHFHKWCFIHCTSKIDEEMEDFYCSKWGKKDESKQRTV